MKTSLQWLSDFLPQLPTAQNAADALTAGGLPVEHILAAQDDTVLDVEVTSNRGDCLCHLGVARELAALLNLPFKDLARPAPAAAAAAAASSGFSVSITAKDVCPQYTAQVVRQVRVAPSPAWMVKRLEAAGIRPINNVVDITNYVMLEMGQPLHAFDLDKLHGGRIIVRRAAAGETLMSIDGHERKLSADMLLIADAQRPVALAGVMGGKETEVSDATVNVLLESARFDPLCVRKTARILAMMSDSSYRFERGIDPTLPRRASARAAQLLTQIAGGKLDGPLAEAGDEGYTPKKLSLRMDKLRRVIGVDYPITEAAGALARLGLSPQIDQRIIHCTVPAWRLDLQLEVDLVEEVARVLGYDRVPVRQEISIRLAAPPPQAAALNQIRPILLGAGYFEAVTFTWISDLLKDDFVPPSASALPRADLAVRKADAHLRPSILPGLLEALRRNEAAGTADARLFEIGQSFWFDKQSNLIERTCLALAGGHDWHELRGVIEAMLRRLNPALGVRIEPASYPGYNPNVCAAITWGDTPLGFMGQCHNDIAQKLSLRQPPLMAELPLEPLVGNIQLQPQLALLPRYPSVRRDVSFIVPELARYQQIEQIIRDLALADMESLEYVTTYRGKPLAAGQKSVTLALVFRSPSATLTSEQVEPTMKQVVQRVTATLEAQVR